MYEAKVGFWDQDFKEPGERLATSQGLGAGGPLNDQLQGHLPNVDQIIIAIVYGRLHVTTAHEK